jgi:hypothetical protein
MTNLIMKQSRLSELLLASIILTSVSFSGASAASDISHKLRQSSEANSATENYFELGLGIATGISPNLTDDEQTWTSGYVGENVLQFTLKQDIAAKSLIGVLEWGLTPQQAADLPNVVARNNVVRVEANTQSEPLIQAIEKYGFNVDGSRGENSGLSIVYKDETGKLIGGVDKRCEGTIAIF